MMFGLFQLFDSLPENQKDFTKKYFKMFNTMIFKNIDQMLLYIEKKLEGIDYIQHQANKSDIEILPISERLGSILQILKKMTLFWVKRMK